MTVEWLWTVEELDALPPKSVIRSRSGVIVESRGGGEWVMPNLGGVQRTCDLPPYRWQVVYAPPVTEVVWDDVVMHMSRGIPLRDFPVSLLKRIPAGTPVRVTVTVIDGAR